METTQTVTWRGLHAESSETFQLDASIAGIRAEGDIAGISPAGDPFEINYLIELSPDWKIMHVLLRDVQHEGRYLDLTHEEGQWFDETGQHLEDFDGLELVDISLTPFTNTLAIERLMHADSLPSQTFDLVYIDGLTFALRRVSQTYTKLNQATYRFDDGEGFTADLTVDKTGLIVDYPGLFERV